MRHLLRQVLRNYSYTSLSGLVDLTVIFTMGVMLPRLLGQQAYGSYVFASAISGFVFGLSELGMNTIVTRELAKRNADAFFPERGLVGNALALRISIGLVAFAVIALVSGTTNVDHQVRTLLVLTSMSYLVLNSTAILVAALAGHMVFRSQLIVTATNRLLSLALIAVALGNHSLIGVAIALFTANLAGVVVAYFLYKQEFGRLGLAFQFKVWAFLIRQSYQVFLSNMASNFALRSDTILLGYYRGVTETGIYSAAYGVLLGIGALSSSFISAANPVVTRSNSQNPAQTRRLFWFLFGIYALAGLFLILVLNAFANQIVLLLFGEEFMSSSVALRLLSFGVAVILLNRLTTNVLVCVDLQRYAFYATLAGTAANLGLNIILIPSMGYIAASITTFVGEVIVLALALALLTSYFVKQQVGRDQKIYNVNHAATASMGKYNTLQE